MANELPNALDVFVFGASCSRLRPHRFLQRLRYLQNAPIQLLRVASHAFFVAFELLPHEFRNVLTFSYRKPSAGRGALLLEESIAEQRGRSSSRPRDVAFGCRPNLVARTRRHRRGASFFFRRDESVAFGGLSVVAVTFAPSVVRFVTAR